MNKPNIFNGKYLMKFTFLLIFIPSLIFSDSYEKGRDIAYADIISELDNRIYFMSSIIENFKTEQELSTYWDYSNVKGRLHVYEEIKEAVLEMKN